MEDDLMKQFQIREAKRKRKKMIIALVPIAFFILIICLIVILVQPAPSCFDNKKNGSEEGIDCGGPCISCGIKYAVPLEVVSSDTLSVMSSTTEVVAKIRNSNADYGAHFSYQINIINLLGQKISQINGESFILPNTSKYLIQDKIPLQSSDVSRFEVVFTKVDWSPLDKSNSDLFTIYDKTARIMAATENGYLELGGKITNKTSHDFLSVDLSFIIYSKTGRLLYAAKTQLSNVNANAIRNFVYNGFPYFNGFSEMDLNRIEFLAEAWPD